MITISDFNELIKESFGHSLYSLFMGIKCCDTMSFDVQKEVFFQLLKHLLSEKKIMLIAPGADVTRNPTHIPKLTIYDKEAQWDISPDRAVQYFQERWPNNITDSNDVELICFLYQMPNIIWIADDGSLEAS